MDDFSPLRSRSRTILLVLFSLMALVGIAFSFTRMELAAEPDEAPPYSLGALAPLSDKAFSDALDVAAEHAGSYGTFTPGDSSVDYFDRVKEQCTWDFSTRVQTAGFAPEVYIRLAEEGVATVGSARIERTHAITAESVVVDVVVTSAPVDSPEERTELGAIMITVLLDESGEWQVSGAAPEADHHAPVEVD